MLHRENRARRTTERRVWCRRQDPNPLLTLTNAASFAAAAPLSMLSLAIRAASLKLSAFPAARSATAALIATTL